MQLPPINDSKENVYGDTTTTKTMTMEKSPDMKHDESENPTLVLIND